MTGMSIVTFVVARAGDGYRTRQNIRGDHGKEIYESLDFTDFPMTVRAEETARCCLSVTLEKSYLD